jgi:hypothetical protein
MQRNLLTPITILIIIGSGFILIGTTACETPDTDNVSERPWNEPRGYQFFGGGTDRRRNR